MKIIEIARGHIKFSVAGRIAKIEGEGFVQRLARGAEDYVDYLVYPETLNKWSDSEGDELIPADLKADILSFLKEDFSRRGQTLAIE